MPTWLFQIVNFVFIGKLIAYYVVAPLSPDVSVAVIQNVILFLLGVPTHVATFQQPSKLSTSDYVLATLAVIDLLCEFTADNQQYSFQTYKQTGVVEKNEWPGANIAWTPEDAKRGFVTKGLWGWSRHPNFFCEQSFWVRLFPLHWYIFSLASRA